MFAHTNVLRGGHFIVFKEFVIVKILVAQVIYNSTRGVYWNLNVTTYNVGLLDQNQVWLLHGASSSMNCKRHGFFTEESENEMMENILVKVKLTKT